MSFSNKLKNYLMKKTLDENGAFRSLPLPSIFISAYLLPVDKLSLSARIFWLVENLV